MTLICIVAVGAEKIRVKFLAGQNVCVLCRCFFGKKVEIVGPVEEGSVTNTHASSRNGLRCMG